MQTNSHKIIAGFKQAKAMKAVRTFFISFIKSLFSILTKEKTIIEACLIQFLS